MEEFRAITIGRLDRLKAPRKQIAFAYLACNRMLQNYQYFSRNFGWGNEYCLIEGLDIIKSFVLGDSREFEKKELLATIYDNIPNSDNFSTPFSTYAQNAASSIYYTLNSIPTVNIQELSWALVLSRDTVDAFIQEKEEYKYDKEFEGKIRSHSIMQRELQKQESDFSFLMNASEISENDLDLLKDFNEGRSIIDVSLFSY
jgi:uncharacterized protein YjaG (DUF416 family)